MTDPPPPAAQLSIQQACDLTGLSPRTVRYWEELGLLPGVPRQNGGRRVYGADAVEQYVAGGCDDDVRWVGRRDATPRRSARLPPPRKRHVLYGEGVSRVTNQNLWDACGSPALDMTTKSTGRCRHLPSPPRSHYSIPPSSRRAFELLLYFPPTSKTTTPTRRTTSRGA